MSRKDITLAILERYLNGKPEPKDREKAVMVIVSVLAFLSLIAVVLNSL